METRAKQYADANLIGRRVEQLRLARGIKQKDFIARLQVAGLDINPTSYSKFEGQLRMASDREVFMIARVLGVPMELLFPEDILSSSPLSKHTDQTYKSVSSRRKKRFLCDDIVFLSFYKAARSPRTHTEDRADAIGSVPSGVRGPRVGVYENAGQPKRLAPDSFGLNGALINNPHFESSWDP